MPNTHTDSQIVEHHEDGTWTETTTITHSPATKAQKATAYGVLGALCVVPFIPVIALVVEDKWRARRDRKAQLKSVPDATN